MSKFYIRLMTEGEFICSADSPELAVLQLWNFQAEKFLKIEQAAWRYLDPTHFSIDVEYWIHEGSEAEAQKVSAALAYSAYVYHPVPAVLAAIDAAIIGQYGEEAWEHFVDEPMGWAVARRIQDAKQVGEGGVFYV